MAQGSFALTGSTSEEIIAADAYRDFLTIQLKGSASIELGIGETAVAGEGVKLINPGDSVLIEGDLAREAINGIGTATTSNGGWQNDGRIQITPVYAA